MDSLFVEKPKGLESALHKTEEICDRMQKTKSLYVLLVLRKVSYGSESEFPNLIESAIRTFTCSLTLLSYN